MLSIALHEHNRFIERMATFKESIVVEVTFGLKFTVQ